MYFIEIDSQENAGLLFEWAHCYVKGLGGLLHKHGYHKQLMKDKESATSDYAPSLLSVVDRANSEYLIHWNDLINAFKKAAPKGTDTSAPFPYWSGLEVLTGLRSVDESGSIIEVEADPLPAKYGLSWLDYAYCKHLESIGKHGKKQSRELKKQLAQYRAEGEHWLFWSEDTPLDMGPTSNNDLGFLTLYPFKLLLNVLWLDKYDDMFKQATRSPIVAMPTNTVTSISRITSGPITIDGQTLLDRHKQPTKLKLVTPTADENTIQMLVGELAPAAQLNVWNLIYVVQERMLLQAKMGNASAQHVIFQGGWSALAREMGIAQQKDNRTIKQTVRFLQSIDVESQGSEIIGLLNAYYDAPLDVLIITVGAALALNAIFNFKRGNRILCPLVDQRLLADLRGQRQTLARQRNAAQIVMLMLSEKSADYADNGYVYLDDKDKIVLAAQSGLTSKVLEKTFDQWIQGQAQTKIDTDPGTKNSAEIALLAKDNKYRYLEMVGSDRYKLADSFRDVEEFLKEQGERRLSGSKGGIKAKANRDKKRTSNKR